MKKPFGYTPYGPVTAVCLNIKLHSSINAVSRLAPFNMIVLRDLPTLNNLTRCEGVVTNATFNAFRETLNRIKLESKIAFMQDELNAYDYASDAAMSANTELPRVLGLINLDEDIYPDDDLPF